MLLIFTWAGKPIQDSVCHLMPINVLQITCPCSADWAVLHCKHFQTAKALNWFMPLCSEIVGSTNSDNLVNIALSHPTKIASQEIVPYVLAQCLLSHTYLSHLIYHRTLLTAVRLQSCKWVWIVHYVPHSSISGLITVISCLQTILMKQNLINEI